MTRRFARPLVLAALAFTALAPDAAAQQPDGPRLATADQQFGVYGWLHDAALEPDAQSAERLRLCGSFVTPDASGAGDVLRGCLLFSRQAGAADVLVEWRELEQLVTGGARMTNTAGGAIRGVVGFGRVGMRARVRTTLDAGSPPDPYVAGSRAALVSYSLAPRAMGEAQKPAHTLNFARVDRVTIEPRADGDRLRVDGVFALQRDQALQRYTAYQEPVRGYLYLSGRSQEWQEWSRLAGSNQIARFFIFGNADSVRVRRPDEAPTAPDRLVEWGRVEPRAVADALDYGPVRQLRATP